MNNNTGRVEPLPRFEPYNVSDPDEPWYRSDRARLFGVVSGITGDFQRPLILYERGFVIALCSQQKTDIVDCRHRLKVLTEHQL